DSNPRYGYPYAAFRVRCFQPLSHLSVAAKGANIPVGRQVCIQRETAKQERSVAPRGSSWRSIAGTRRKALATRLTQRAAAVSPSQPMIKSAIARLFLSLLTMSLLPF